MNGKTNKWWIMIMLGCLLPAGLQAQPENRYIREGNKSFSKKNYDESEVQYRKALEENGGSYKAGFNLGGALYKQEKYKEASEQFADVPSADLSAQDRARYFHNLGNSLLQENKISESIDAYKEALRNNPGDMETKYNLSVALRRLQEQQQQQNQQGNQGNQDKQKQQSQQDQQKQQPGDQEKPRQDQQQGTQDQKDRQDQPRSEKQPQQEGGQQPKDRISKADAERLLKALADDEKKVQEKVQKAEAKATAIKVEKE